MSTEANKAIIRRLVEEFWNQRQVHLYDALFADSFVDHNPLPGTEGTKEGFRPVPLGIQAAFADGRLSLDDILADGDRVCWRWTYSGTHTGPLMGAPATNKHITFGGINIDRIANGQIVERWHRLDVMGLRMQLGLIPAPGQGRH